MAIVEITARLRSGAYASISIDADPIRPSTYHLAVDVPDESFIQVNVPPNIGKGWRDLPLAKGILQTTQVLTIDHPPEEMALSLTEVR